MRSNSPDAAIIDTHVHVLSDDVERYPRRSGAPEWPSLGAAQLIELMDAAGIARAVLVQTFFTYGYDNRCMLDVARAHPARFASVCVLDQLAPEAPDALSALVAEHGVSGVRLMVANRRGILGDPRTYPLWERAQALNVSVSVGAGTDSMPDALQTIERFPDVPVVLEQGWGSNPGSAPYEQLAPFFRAAGLPNVRVKIGPDIVHAVRAAGGSPADLFARLAERFGPHRLMFGSNLPANAEQLGSLNERLDVMKAELSVLGDEAQRWIFGGTAAAFYPC